jgi:hypothetical protein
MQAESKFFIEVDEQDVRGALMIRKLLSGRHRFNYIQRSVPLMSPALLAKRLKTLQLYTIIDQRVLLGRAQRTLRNEESFFRKNNRKGLGKG